MKNQEHLAIIRGLRRRIHQLEKHNQHFERCESSWCHPSDDNDPAREMGEPDTWPADPQNGRLDAFLARHPSPRPSGQNGESATDNMRYRQNLL